MLIPSSHTLKGPQRRARSGGGDVVQIRTSRHTIINQQTVLVETTSTAIHYANRKLGYTASLTTENDMSAPGYVSLILLGKKLNIPPHNQQTKSQCQTA